MGSLFLQPNGMKMRSGNSEKAPDLKLCEQPQSTEKNLCQPLAFKTFKRFGTTQAMDNLSLTSTLRDFRLLFPNGAGKTTCIRMIPDI